MLNRQKFRDLQRRKDKAEETVFQVSQRINRRKGESTIPDRHLLERASLALKQIEREIESLTEEGVDDEHIDEVA